MSDNINKMDFKQLRNEVQLLRDELAIMKRKYEDILYNLDDDNFSSRIVKEKGDMKTAIEVNAEGIKTKVSQEDLDKYSTIEQTAESIQSVVSKGAKLDEAIVIESIDKATNTEAIYVIQEKDGKGKILSETYYYFNDITKQWEVLSGDSIYTVFKQTPDGFALQGNVLIDGSAVVTKNLELSGVVKWNMDNSPVKARYSTNGSSWHDTFEDGDMYMQMTFDGGKNYGKAVQIVGKDGENGTNGVVDYSRINAILESNYGIYSTTLSSASISSPTIYSADIYSPNIYGQNLTLVAQNKSNSSIYNNLYLTPTSMSLVNAYKGNEKEKFYIELGADADNSSVKMRLGAGSTSTGKEALNIEKYDDEIRIGTYQTSGKFIGIIITPSSGDVVLSGTVTGI